ncbi:MAG: hypothetical protein D6704_00745 [Nitrospirae bacterium]|nr:MAG: hypothetical protein D6704_00745 [Nitrospirota bacterium]
MVSSIVAWLHLLAAVMLIGGLLFIQCVLRPAVASETDKASHMMRLVGRRFRIVAWISITGLILTGAYRLLQESGSGRLETSWGAVLMVKLFLFAIAVGLLLIHDFIMDPFTVPSGLTEPLPASRLQQCDRVQKAALVAMLGVLLVAAYLGTV